MENSDTQPENGAHPNPILPEWFPFFMADEHSQPPLVGERESPPNSDLTIRPKRSH